MAKKRPKTAPEPSSGRALAYRATFNPATGEHIQYILTGNESAGACVRFRWASDAGGRIVEHTHPHSAEIFTILDGRATFTLAGTERTLGPGESIVVPARTAHSESNLSGAVVHGIVELRPARLAAELHDALAAISSTMPVTAAGAPRNPLQLGATFWFFRHDLVATSPPGWLQPLLLAPLAALSALARVRGYRDEWSSRLPGAQTAAPLFDETAYLEQLERGGYAFPLSDPRPPAGYPV
jgi:quercetin dioxygenase-like cupin family protein